MSLTTNDLSPDQLDVYTRMYDWAENRQSMELTVGGLAGTGKSTLLSLFVAARPVRTMAVITYTGKASSVVRKKLLAAGVELVDETRDVKGERAIPKTGGPVFCGTMHALIYIPVLLSDGSVKGYKLRTRLDRSYDLICIDEGSMVGEEALETLRTFEVPLLIIGDHGQLPPVASTGSALENPDMRLEKIHRQAEKNPIIRLAHHARQWGEIDEELADGKYITVAGRDVREDVLTEKYADLEEDTLFDYATIVATNLQRVRTNAIIRKARGRRGLRKGEQIICLRNEKPVFNGMRGILRTEPEEGRWPWQRSAVADFPDEGLYGIPVSMLTPQFNRERTFDSVDEMRWAKIPIEHMEQAGGLYDFGYALTCHKAQGSQFKDVTVIMSRLGYMSEEDKARWIYTAISRASERITVLL